MELVQMLQLTSCLVCNVEAQIDCVVDLRMMTNVGNLSCLIESTGVGGVVALGCVVQMRPMIGHEDC